MKSLGQYKGLTQAKKNQFSVYSPAIPKSKGPATNAKLIRISSTHQIDLGDRDVLIDGLSNLKTQLENYLKSDSHDSKYTFGHFLKEYIKVLNKKRKVFAKEIGIDETLLSQFINLHRLPPDYLTIRLELHSNNIIPAVNWYKLIEKQKEYYLGTNQDIRAKEKKFVKSSLTISV